MPGLDLARSMVSEVGFDSQITPSYAADPFAPTAPGTGLGATIMGWIKPRFWVRTPAGKVSWAGYGEPTVDYTPVLAIGAVAAVAAVVGVGILIGRRLERRKKRGRK